MRSIAFGECWEAGQLREFGTRGRWGSLALVWVLAGSAMLGCSPPPAISPPDGGVLTKNGTMNGRDAFEINVPSSCQLTTNGLQIDFEVYRVTCGTTDYVGVYVGNFPDESVPRSRLLRTRYTWPAQVQVWSLSVPGDQARADVIASSVRIRDRN